MGLFSFIGSCVSSVSNFISSAASSFGGLISSAVSAISPALGLGISAVGKIASVAQGLMQAFGIFKPDEKIEDMGDRMLQAADAGIKPEGYDKFDEYMAEIRSRKLDPEKSKDIAEEVKKAAGVTLSTLALQDKFKDSGTINVADIWLLAGRNGDYFNADKLGSVLNNIKDIKSVVDYFDKKSNISTQDAVTIEKQLFDIEKTASPEKPDHAIYEELKSMKHQ